MANMKTCCNQRATLTTLERWQRRSPPSHLPVSDVTSGAGRIREAPIRSAKHKCCIKMKCVERSLMQLWRMLLMTHALALMEKSTSSASSVPCNGPFRIDTGVANSKSESQTSIESANESLLLFTLPTLLLLMFTGRS